MSKVLTGKSAKSIVICLDPQRTSESALTYDTSVIGRFYSYLLKGNSQQRLLYTDFTGIRVPKSPGPLRSLFQRTRSRNPTLADEAVSTLSRSTYKDKIFEIYSFITEHYETGDDISIFTSGQGALIACAVVGMIQQIGIITGSAGNTILLYVRAYKAYMQTISKDQSRSDANSIKEQYSVDATVRFLGIWDAEEVDLCGEILPQTPHKFRHALSLRSPTAKIIALRAEANTVDSGTTDWLQAWFEGNSNDKNSLSDISLRWMTIQCNITSAGVLFDPGKKTLKLEEVENSAILSKQNISAESLLLIVKRLFSISKEDFLSYQLEQLEKSGSSEDIREVFNAFLAERGQGSETIAHNETQQVERVVNGGSTERRSQGTGDGAPPVAEEIKWNQNADFLAVLCSKVEKDPQRLKKVQVIGESVPERGANQPEEDDNANIHWTVKQRNVIIELLGGPYFKDKEWPDKGAEKLLGDKVYVPKPPKVTWIV